MTERYDQTVDVLIAGAGVAGLMAGVAAAMEGASVLMVEKQPIPGGSSYISGGFFAFAGTDEQREIGVTDSEEQLRDDLLAVGGAVGVNAIWNLVVRQFPCSLTAYAVSRTRARRRLKSARPYMVCLGLIQR